MRLNKFKYLTREQYQQLIQRWKEINNNGDLNKVPVYITRTDTIDLVSRSSYRLHLFYLGITGKDLSAITRVGKNDTNRLHNEMGTFYYDVRHKDVKHFKAFFGDIIPNDVYVRVFNDLVILFRENKLINHTQPKWSWVKTI